VSKFNLIYVNDYVKWNKFVEKSLQGSIFSNSQYLVFTEKRHVLYYVIKGNKVKAGISLILNNSGTSCKFDDFVIYNGIMFDESVTTRFERFKLTEFIINELIQKYNKLEMQLSPQFEDLRPFLWHNYHNSGKKFTINLRYTSYIDLSKTNTQLLKDLQQLRRRNINEAQKVGASVTIGLEIDLFLTFYRNLMLAQGNEVSDDKLFQMGYLIHKLIENKQAQMFITKNPQDEIIYIAIFCFDSKRAYYLFGAGNPKTKERYKGTITFWNAFKILKEDYGIKQIDFEGVNSPQRGWFKLGFGGSLLPYYQVIL